MASTRSKTDTKTVTLEEFGRDVARRLEAAGELQIPRNVGTRRTASKRALLKAIEAVAGKW
jgi:hypothetical protein